MKSILTSVCFLFIVIFAYPSMVKGKEIPIPFDSTSNKYAYIEVIEIDTSARFLYDNAKKWLFEKYLNQDLLFDEKGEKLIQQGSFEIISTLKGGMGVNLPYNYTINFTIIFEFKQGRYRYTITNIKLSQNAEGTTSEQSIENFIDSNDEMRAGRKRMGKFIEQTCNLIDDEFKLLITEMKNSVVSKHRKVDDW